jgi:hypothetical protein
MAQVDSQAEGTFNSWAREWMELARFEGRTLSDAPERIDNIVKLWDRRIPGDNWKPQPPKRLSGARYTRGNVAAAEKRLGEHAIEYAILSPDPLTNPTMCLGRKLIDGINAVPLAKDVGGGRIGNVEADLLLLVENDVHGYELQLVEVKAASNNAWYAVVELLRQLKLLSENPAMANLFESHRGVTEGAGNLLVTGVVLAPPDFFDASGQKKNAVEHARTLISAFAPKDLHVELATWNGISRAMVPLGS